MEVLLGQQLGQCQGIHDDGQLRLAAAVDDAGNLAGAAQAAGVGAAGLLAQFGLDGVIGHVFLLWMMRRRVDP
jgi:hypothetical protein